MLSLNRQNRELGGRHQMSTSGLHTHVHTCMHTGPPYRERIKVRERDDRERRGEEEKGEER